MSPRPEWLPEMIETNGVWDSVCETLYGVFHQDFVLGKPILLGLPVWWNRKIRDGRFEEAFWHLITQLDEAGVERLFDPRRAERLPWCGPSIRNAHEPSLLVWDFKEGNGVIRTYIWYRAGDYVIVLEKKQQRGGLIAFLVTAHHIEREGRRRSLEAKYQKRVL